MSLCTMKQGARRSGGGATAHARTNRTLANSDGERWGLYVEIVSHNRVRDRPDGHCMRWYR